MITSLLIANRGEIACRIVRTCRRMGIRTVAVFSDADRDARHVKTADEAIWLGAAPATESYLAIPKIITAAQQTGVDAIHPGFGFLAENAAFARACAEAGFIFIGPSPATIEQMGDKRAAKELVAQSNVPLIPGYTGIDQSDVAFLQAATEIGYPVMVKAAAGGGGKGMRLVYEASQLPEALAGARREALQAFGSPELMLEKALFEPRHIEFQVFADQHGGVVHLGERECSIQRRHQKVVEECPSPVLTPELRQKMGETAVSVARAAHYTNAGTVEFLLDKTGQFYFLEMNTRLQVEHPVTEMVMGVDLVEWQIRVAEGEPLPSFDLQMDGHAIEVRVYAENPANEFLPVTGNIQLWREPTGEGVRVESGIQTGSEVSIYYDPMLAKVIAWGVDRKTAVRRLLYALQNTTLLGVVNNLPFLDDVLRHPAFQAGEMSTPFIAKHFVAWQQPSGDVSSALIVAALLQLTDNTHTYYRNNPNRSQIYRFQVADRVVDVAIEAEKRQVAGSRWQVQLSNAHYQVLLHTSSSHECVVTINGRYRRLFFASQGPHWWVQTADGVVEFQTVSLLPPPKTAVGTASSLRAPMPGTVLTVLVETGQRVEKGQPLLKLEAMKMEHTIRAAADGVVEAIYYTAGDRVDADAQLLKIGQ